MEVGEIVVDILQFLAPVGVFVYFVEIKPTTATFGKLSGQLINAMGIEPDIVHTSIQHRLIEFVA